MLPMIVNLLNDGGIAFVAVTDTCDVPLASFDGASVDPDARAALLAYLFEQDPAMPTSYAIARALGADIRLYCRVPAYPWPIGIHHMTRARRGEPRTLRLYLPLALPATAV